MSAPLSPAMDDFTAEMLAGAQYDGSPQSPERPRARDIVVEPAAEPGPQPEPATPPQRTGLRGGLAAIRERASIQDRLVEKLLQQVIPTEDNAGSDGPIIADDKAPAFAQRPNFNITTMSNNFRRFNARIGVVFKFQARVLRLLSWRQTSHTMSLLAVYTFVCLDPYLLFVLPIAVLILGVLIPAFLARHPAPPKGTLSSEQNVGYTPRGPPLAPAATVKPVKELSRDFFRNMRDLQNCMEDFSLAHDKFIELLVPLTNFSDEALSSAVFQFLFVGGVIMSVSAHLLPWRFVFLLSGWGAICMGHPSVARFVSASRQEHLQPREQKARSTLDNWIANDVILDSAPESREVEIFELQRMSSAGEWEPWLFSPSPYDPLSHPRISGERARAGRASSRMSCRPTAGSGARRSGRSTFGAASVEVETEGERWVYDMYDEREERTGVVEASERNEKDAEKSKPVQKPSWEEGQDTTERRGDWRRRRWVRLVKRRVSQTAS
ncbi:Peroxisomal membrane protein PEX29 [Paramyrothecium foliicola]|nr:Peroxisomal membrane protein PEX29 [Paramyrothecium foliicola]